MTANKTIRRGDNELLFSKKVDCCKWFDNQSVIMLFSNVEGMATILTVL